MRGRLLAILLLCGLALAARAQDPYAIDERGRRVPPDMLRCLDLYHGNGGYTEADVPRLWREGLPAKPGTDRDLAHHKLEHRDARGLTTMFRGAAPYPAMPGAIALMPVEAADEGGLVFQIRGVPAWDVARHAARAEGIVPGEVEYAVLARVEPPHIARIGVVAANRLGQKYVVRWHDNPRPARAR